MNIDEIGKKLYLLLEEQGIYISNKEEDINLLDYLIDSISIIEFIISIEDCFNIEVGDNMISYEILVSFNGLCNLIKEIVDTKVE